MELITTWPTILASTWTFAACLKALMLPSGDSFSSSFQQNLDDLDNYSLGFTMNASYRSPMYQNSQRWHLYWELIGNTYHHWQRGFEKSRIPESLLLDILSAREQVDKKVFNNWGILLFRRWQLEILRMSLWNRARWTPRSVWENILRSRVLLRRSWRTTTRRAGWWRFHAWRSS